MRDLMIKDPITVNPDDDIEFAAQLIYNHKIGGMPVVKDGRLTGIITATDILRTFIDMMGIYPPGSILETRSGALAVVVSKSSEPGAPLEALLVRDPAGRDIDPEPFPLATADVSRQLLAQPGTHLVVDAPGHDQQRVLGTLAIPLHAFQCVAPAGQECLL